MSNEKLREVIKRLLKAHRITVQAPPKTITDAENQLREIENAVKYAEEALATTEPVMANGLTEAETDASASVVGLTQRVDWFPELEPIGEIVGTRGTPINTPEFWGYFTEGFKTDLKLRVVTIEQAKAYGEQCWKAGYKHGAWGDKPTSKQSLQVEPAVNQQLTTEPVDEREAFESEMSKPPFEFCMDRWPDDGAYAWPGNYAAYHTQCAWVAWRARAAMAKGVKG